MLNMDILLRNPQYLADLLNGPCKPKPLFGTTTFAGGAVSTAPGYIEDSAGIITASEPVPMKVTIMADGRIRLGRKDSPVKPVTPELFIAPESIDLEASSYLTAVYNSLLPSPVSFFIRAVAVPQCHILMIIAFASVDEHLLENYIRRLTWWEAGNSMMCETSLCPPAGSQRVESLVVGLYLGNGIAPYGFYSLRHMNDLAARKLVAVYDQDLEEAAILPQPAEGYRKRIYMAS